MMRLFLFSLSAILVLTPLSAPGQPVSLSGARPLVGVSYFAGWWEELPNKWQYATGGDWRADYPERVPLLGEYNTQETMDREIRAAAEYGVDFFAMLWYFEPEGTEREPHSNHLQRGILNFLASPEAGRMKFMIEFCNHPPYLVASEEEWTLCIEKWVSWMKHPSYLKLNGRPVFKVHGFHHFMKQLHDDTARAREWLVRFRDAARNAGVGEVWIGCGVGGQEGISADHPAASLFDFTGTYMDLPPLPRQEEDYPYERLADFAGTAREIHWRDALPWMPYLPAGWCPKPWPDSRAYFKLPEPAEWRRALCNMKADLERYSSLGLPGQAAFTIYAWNEFGEGGFIAPTRTGGYDRLEAIREVFGNRGKIQEEPNH